jgi:RNA polymerase sigma factor (sigma-70 family)
MNPWLSDVLLRSQSDERLVDLARAGHERAFVAIVERYRRQLEAFARRFSSDGHADDLVQQTFLSAFVALRGGAEVRHLRGWLHQILRNAAIRTAARERLEPQWDEAMIARGQYEDGVEDRELAHRALAEVAQLPARQREALVATAIQGRSRVEVAGSMGVSEGAVRQLVLRARVAVRGAVAGITPYPIAQWLTGGDGPGVGRGAELALAPASASAAGVAVKLGAAIATGILSVGGVAATLPGALASHSGKAHVTNSARLLAASQPAAARKVAGSRPILGINSQGSLPPSREVSRPRPGDDGPASGSTTSGVERGSGADGSSHGDGLRSAGHDGGTTRVENGGGGSDGSGSGSGLDTAAPASASSDGSGDGSQVALGSSTGEQDGGGSGGGGSGLSGGDSGTSGSASGSTSGGDGGSGTTSGSATTDGSGDSSGGATDSSTTDSSGS